MTYKSDGKLCVCLVPVSIVGYCTTAHPQEKTFQIEVTDKPETLFSTEGMPAILSLSSSPEAANMQAPGTVRLLTTLCYRQPLKTAAIFHQVTSTAATEAIDPQIARP